MFQDCSSLEELDLSYFNTQSVRDMGRMFLGCSSLTSLDLSHFTTSNVTDISLMFHRCEALTSIKFGENFTTSIVTDMTNMFDYCCSLTSLDLSGFNFDGNPGCAGMFDGIGENATNKPISIFVTSAGKEYLEGQGTDIDENYAQLVVEAALDGQDGGSW